MSYNKIIPFGIKFKPHDLTDKINENLINSEINFDEYIFRPEDLTGFDLFFEPDFITFLNNKNDQKIGVLYVKKNYIFKIRDDNNKIKNLISLCDDYVLEDELENGSKVIAKHIFEDISLYIDKQLNLKTGLLPRHSHIHIKMDTRNAPIYIESRYDHRYLHKALSYMMPKADFSKILPDDWFIPKNNLKHYF